MKHNKHTRLRYIRGNDIDDVLRFVHSLPFQIEIKGNPVNKGSKWYLFFNLPDGKNEIYERFESIDLDD